MKKIISLALIGLALSGCAFISKLDIEQGNIITENQVRELHPGMSEAEVKAVMGNPVLVNLFSPDRIDYIYTMEKAHQKMQAKRVICIFRNNVLRDVITN